MSSEKNENKKEKEILTFFTYSGLGIFMVVIAVVLFINMRDKNIITPPELEKTSPTLEMPEVKILSSEEVSSERFTLERTNEIVEKERAGLSVYDDSPEIKIPEPIKIDIPPTPADPAVVQKAEQEKKAKDPATKYSDAMPNGVNPSPTQKPFANFAEKAKTSTLVSKSLTGTVLSFNYNGNRLLIDKNGGGHAIINVDSKTQFKINGKNITVRDLKVGDSISAVGKGYDFTDEMIAEEVKITGSLKFF